MNKQRMSGDTAQFFWDQLREKFRLTEKQVAQLTEYAQLLIEWNKKFNVTAITDTAAIVQSHFYDSLCLADYVDFNAIHSTADVGTGGGFPGLPLKILFPHLTVVLIEVNNKKRSFLEHVIEQLGLSDVIIYPFDWRTFIRTTNYQIDYFFARASLQPEELIRIFKPTSPYQKAVMVYWASHQWIAQKAEKAFLEKEVEYYVGDVHRKYVFFKK